MSQKDEIDKAYSIDDVRKKWIKDIDWKIQRKDNLLYQNINFKIFPEK